VTNEIWRNDNENASDVRIISNRIISNTGLDSMTTTLAAIITAAITTFKTTGIATMNLRLKVNAQPVIKIKGFTLRKLLKLKHNQQSINQNDFNNTKNRD
jgi:hypothetical protein